MFDEICDQIDIYCEEALISASNMSFVDEFDMIFESDDPALAHKNLASEQSKKESGNFIHKAIEAIKNLINKIREAITNFINKRKLSPEERQAYDEFLKQCKSNPEMANKKVTVQNWKVIEKEYDELMSRIENDIRQEEAGKVTDVEALKNKVEGFLKGAGAEATAIITAEAMVNYARSNADMAWMLKGALDKEGALMKQLEAQLGKRQATAVRKDVVAMTRIVSLRKLKVMLFHKRCQGIESITSAANKFVKGFIAPGKMNRQIAKSEHLGQVYKTSRGAILKGAALGVKDKATGFVSGGVKKALHVPEKRSGFSKIRGAAKFAFSKPKKEQKAQPEPIDYEAKFDKEMEDND